ncbi:uncharacterized protein LOC131876267 [Cryptomeria japonica]|uniref:uncharacterized protein LOC131876267 n=1 Tax=Cryptomeria japonica TaxID=3369 RepID=UPI0027DA23CB|nr:uncharacterized protein LOC131876267 [Cryptomeria japonica]
MGITREVVQRAREKNILKDEDMVKPKEAKPQTPPPKPRYTRSSTPSSDSQIPPNSPKPQAHPSDGVVKRKKEQPHRVYVEAPVKEEETKSDEVVKEVKKSTTSARVVKRKLLDEGKPSKKPRDEVEIWNNTQASKGSNN